MFYTSLVINATLFPPAQHERRKFKWEEVKGLEIQTYLYATTFL